jgi:DNA-binding XRE family transcriptional regulator
VPTLMASAASIRAAVAISECIFLSPACSARVLRAITNGRPSRAILYDRSWAHATGSTLARVPERPEAALRRVAHRIADIRRAKGVTQDAIAEKLRCATRNYQRIEYGEQNLSLRTLVRIANLLGVTIADLVTPPPALKKKGLPKGG